MPDKTGSTSLVIPNKWYNRLKFVAQILLPAVATFYFAVASIWGLPKAEEVVGTLTALDALLGAVLGLSAKQYNARTPYDGIMEFIEVPHPEDETRKKKVFTLALEGDPDELQDQQTVTFRVAQK